MKLIQLVCLLTIAVYGHSQSSINEKVDSVLQLMTLTEKVGQMNLYNGFWDVTGPKPQNGDALVKYKEIQSGLVGSMLNVYGVEKVRKVQQLALDSRLGIPLLFGFDVIHGFKTIFPIPLAEAASWDLDAIENSARMAAKEAASVGINWTFAPMVDISRDARWGRVMEGAGEDVYLGSKIAMARVKGFQGNELSNPLTIAATAKHFAGYGFPTAGKDYNTVDVGTATLHNQILPPFKAALNAGVRTFMNGFNDLNGIPVTAHKGLQREILKDEWGFTGFVVSDWGSINELVNHGYAKNQRQAAEFAVKAGSDLDLESNAYRNHLVQLVKDGVVSESIIDDAVKRILRVKFELGLFDDPFRYCDINREQQIIGSNEMQKAVLDMAKKSIVLLKNENNILPIAKQNLSIGVIGPLAADKSSPLGNWRLAGEDGSAVSVIEGLQHYTGNDVSFKKGVELVTNTPSFPKEVFINETDTTGFVAAINLAKTSDVVIMVLGEHGYQTGEGRSRATLGLPGLQQQLLESVFEVNQQIVLVLMNGRPLAIPWADENIPAIVEAWHLGSQSGNAIAEVLYGDYNPSGKLPMTFPRSVGQVPIYYNYKSTGRPKMPAKDEVFWSHYIDESNHALYPFGYGLSYTTFSYSNISLSANELNSNSQIEATVSVTNTGNRFGKEVVQMYIRDHFASRTRPVRELKGFQLVPLSPGESKEITFTIDITDLAFYSANNIWEAEPGNFTLWIGTNSQTTNSANFKLID